MKRLNLIVLLLLFSSSLFSVGVDDPETTYSPSSPFRMIGYVKTTSNFTAALNYEVLPFDLENPILSPNLTGEGTANLTSVRGLQVGKYSLFCNSNFILRITHTKLQCVTPSVGTTKETELDYRLDVFFNSTSNGFLCCASTSLANMGIPGEIVITQASVNNPEKPNTYEIIEKAMYVSLVDPMTFVAEVEPGSYESTISFEFTAGQ